MKIAELAQYGQAGVRAAFKTGVAAGAAGAATFMGIISMWADQAPLPEFARGEAGVVEMLLWIAMLAILITAFPVGMYLGVKVATWKRHLEIEVRDERKFEAQRF